MQGCQVGQVALHGVAHAVGQVVLRRGGDHVGQLVVRPLVGIQVGGLGDGVVVALGGDDGGAHIHAQQHAEHGQTQGGGPHQQAAGLFSQPGHGHQLAAGQVDDGERAEAEGQEVAGGEVHLHGGVDEDEQQHRAQGGGHGVRLGLRGGVLTAQAEYGRGAGNQQSQPQGTAQDAGVHQGLDIVVVDVFRLVVVGLDAVNAVFKAAHAHAHKGAALEELQAVLTVDQALHYVALGEKVLDALGDGLGQELVVELQTAGGRAAVGRGGDADGAVGGENEGDGAVVRRGGKGRAVGRAGVGRLLGVHDGVLLRLGEDGDGDRAVGGDGEGVVSLGQVRAAGDGLAGLERGRAGPAHRQHQQGGDGGQGGQQDDVDDPDARGELVRQGAAHEDVQRAEGGGAQQRHQQRPGAQRPLAEGGGEGENGGQQRQEQRLRHEDEGGGTLPAAGEEQVGQERHRHGGHSAAADGQDEGGAGDEQAAQVQAALLFRGGAGGQPQGQQQGDARCAGENVGVFKDGLQALALKGLVAEGHAQGVDQAAQAVIQPAGGDHVDADKAGQRAGDLQHRGGAAARVQRVALGLAAGERQGHAGGGGDLEELVEGEFAAGGVEGGDAVQQDVQSQQQGGQRQPLGQRAAAHHHADDGTEDQQQGDELVLPLEHHAGEDEVYAAQQRYEPGVLQLLDGHRVFAVRFLCHVFLLFPVKSTI